MSLWWPEDLEGLEVHEVATGLEFTAPPDTPCGQWLHYWSETPEREDFFSSEIIKVLLEAANMRLTNPKKIKEACTKTNQNV